MCPLRKTLNCIERSILYIVITQYAKEMYFVDVHCHVSQLHLICKLAKPPFGMSTAAVCTFTNNKSS